MDSLVAYSILAGKQTIYFQDLEDFGISLPNENNIFFECKKSRLLSSIFHYLSLFGDTGSTIDKFLLLAVLEPKWSFLHAVTGTTTTKRRRHHDHLQTLKSKEFKLIMKLI